MNPDDEIGAVEQQPGIGENSAASDNQAVYEHAQYERRRNFLRFLLRVIGLNFLAKVARVDGYENIPAVGPTIVMINHIAFVDPVMVIHLYPRNLVPMAKREIYSYPVINMLAKIWWVIPVDREGMDRQALRQAEKVLAAGEVVLIAPEGTRGPALQEGREGAAFLALHSGAPILPTAVDHTEGYPTLPFTRRWREPGAVVRFGKPFRFKPQPTRPDRAQLRLMMDEAMIVLARLLPEARRGIYADRVGTDLHTIEFLLHDH